ncbi:MAG TPA: beta-ketoacyl-ACP synthase III [Oligoflexia bacterium]|nr:beta-ketoacyl-ACP synthase III [Oligoflexia bacterium]HMP27752.1 beta-ketoacyl-ACP synthase III [Oligoflexia bacterium]
MKPKTKITATASCLPETIVTNDDLAKLMDTSDEWIRERTGIRQRRFAKKGVETTAALATSAARQALAQAGWKAESLDLIIASTLSPDYYFPGIGVLVQKDLACKEIPALDIRAQCSGFVYGVACADSFIKSGMARKILLVCSEVQSLALDLTTRGREMAVLFGDGAGAILLENEAEGDSEVIDSVLGSDGRGAESLMMRLPGTANAGFITEEDISSGKTHPSMDGKTVFKNAVSRLIESIGLLLARNNLSANQIALLLPHQANLRINEMVREHFKLPPEKVANNIDKYGNTTSATIPILLDEALKDGKIRRGDLIITAAFGSGFTWGCNLIKY